MGVSVIGDARSAYAQNEKNLQQYEARLGAGELPLQRGHVLSHEDSVVRSLLWMLRGGAAAKVDEAASLAPEQFARDGLVEVSGRRVKVTEIGRAFLRHIWSALDRYHLAAAA